MGYVIAVAFVFWWKKQETRKIMQLLKTTLKTVAKLPDTHRPKD